MRKAKFYSALIVIFLSSVICNAQSNLKTSLRDLNKLVGNWDGSLTYLDYSTGKPYTMPANLVIKRINKTNNYSFINIYTNEPSANSIDTIVVSEDGKFFDGKLIKSRRKMVNGNFEFITEDLGKDGNDNREATIRITYSFNQSSFSKRKDIQFLGDTTWIKRHEYLYKRKLSK